MGEWLDSWMNSRSDWRPTSLERARGIVELHIKPQLGKYLLGSLDHQTVQSRGRRALEVARTIERSQDRQRALREPSNGG